MCALFLQLSYFFILFIFFGKLRYYFFSISFILPLISGALYSTSGGCLIVGNRLISEWELKGASQPALPSLQDEGLFKSSFQHISCCINLPFGETSDRLV